MSLFSAAVSIFLDLIFPRVCADCRAEGAALCDACASAIRILAPSCFVCKKLAPTQGSVPAGRTCKVCRKKSRIFTFISHFSYDTPTIKTLIHDLKYRKVSANAAILGDLLHRAILRHRISFPANSLIIPIPLHKTRERARGFNQSLLIAQALGEKLGIETQGDILQKTKATEPQMGLTREQRLQNMSGAFAVSDTTFPRNRTILLLDDVKTTGATLEHAARVLRDAGAKRIWAITIAR